jgi:hypothetical protein
MVTHGASCSVYLSFGRELDEQSPPAGGSVDKLFN